VRAFVVIVVLSVSWVAAGEEPAVELVEEKIARLPKKVKGVPPISKAAVDDQTAARVKAAIEEGVKLRATDAAAAEKMLLEAVKLDPGSLLARYELASLWAAGGRHDDALALLRDLGLLDCDPCWELVESSLLDDDWRALWMDDRWIELSTLPDARWPDPIASGWFDQGCPAGTKMVKDGKLPKEQESARGGAVWCEKKVGKKRVKHGPYTEWQEMPSWSHSNAEETRKKVEGEYVDGVPVGIWTFWEGVDARCGYKNGARHGRWVILEDMGPSRIVYDEGAYLDGNAEGLHLHYDSDRVGYDVPETEQEYRAGVRHGRYVRRDQDGVVEEGKYVDGKKDGLWKEEIVAMWLASSPRASGHYAGDLMEGIWTVEEEGAKTWELSYVKGVLDGEQRRLGEGGKVVGSFTVKAGAGDAVIWNAAGVKIAEGKIAKGVRAGVWKLYDEGSGAKVGEGAFDANLRRTGPWTEWHANGAKASVGAWKGHENRHGKWTFWHANGKKRAEGTFKEGSAQGTWKVWKDDGTAQTLTMNRNGDIARIDGNKLDEARNLGNSEVPEFQTE
jgi:antitoxin component YwqK of YwqJK toxin-antitoxin module